MKVHGLWRFHHEARKARELFKDLSIRWWVDEELEQCRRMMSVMHFGWGRRAQFSNADALVACAARYRRMYGGIRTVGEWNALILRIAKRSGYDHHTTLKSAQVHYAYRDKSPIFFHVSEHSWKGDRACAKFALHEINERLRRAKQSSAERQRERKEKQDREWFLRDRLIRKDLSEAQETVSLINNAIKSAKAAIKEKYA